MASNGNRPRALERVASLAHNITFSKLCKAVNYGAAANIYKPITIADMELSSPQCLLLAFLNSLVTGDVMSCLLLANVCQQVQQLRSKYLKVWLTEDFVFPKQEMEKAMALLVELVATGVLKLSPHMMGIMSSVAVKYGITSVQLTSSSEEDDCDLAIKMKNAVSSNSPAEIINLVIAGGDVNGLTTSGDSLLHLAVRTGNHASIAALGFLKADLEIVNSSMATPLEIAVRNNDTQSVRALLMAGAKIDKHLLRGDTYLHIAAAGGHNGALSALLEEGLGTNVKNHFDETPLFQALKAGNVFGFEILMERGADVSIVPKGSKSLVEIIVESQNVAMFKVFIKLDNLPALHFNDDDSLLHFVAKSGNAGMLKILKDLRMPGNIKNKMGVTPLHDASDISIVRILLGMGLIIDEQDIKGCTALMIAANNSKPDIVNFLLYSGANPNLKDNNNMTPLHYAAAGGHVEIVKAFLEVGARLEEKDNEGKTPAFLAAVNNRVSALELFIECGADKSVKDLNGEEMIHHAARNGHSDIVSVLLGSGVMVDVKAPGDRTPLHYAAENGNASVVSVLLNRGADVRAMTNLVSSSGDNIPSGHNSCNDSHSYGMFGSSHRSSRNRTAFGPSANTFPFTTNSSLTLDSWTPLIAASKVGCLDVVRLLLDEGAPVNDRDSIWGRTALGWAVNNKHSSVVDYLRSVGGIE